MQQQDDKRHLAGTWRYQTPHTGRYPTHNLVQKQTEDEKAAGFSGKRLAGYFEESAKCDAQLLQQRDFFSIANRYYTTKCFKY
jgi:hypothetical protein